MAGEGGTKASGKLLLGGKHRVNLGRYPAVSIAEARAKAARLLEQAQRGVSPLVTASAARTAGGLTIEDLSKEFLQQYVYSRELDSARKYELAFARHINSRIGRQLAERLNREQVRAVMDAARIRRKRPAGERGGPIGGVEAGPAPLWACFATGTPGRSMKRSAGVRTTPPATSSGTCRNARRETSCCHSAKRAPSGKPRSRPAIRSGHTCSSCSSRLAAAMNGPRRA